MMPRADLLSPRWRKVLRDLGRSRTRTLLVVLSIAVGVFAVGTIATTRLALDRDLAGAYAATNPASAIAFASPFDEELVKSVRRVDGVRQAEGRRRVGARVKVGPHEWRNLSLEMREDLAQSQIGALELDQGVWSPPKGSLLVERSSLTLLHVAPPVAPATTIQIETPDGKQHSLAISGVLHDLNRPPAIFSSGIFGYVSAETLEALHYGRGYNELHLVVAERPADVRHIRSVADRVKARVQQAGRNVFGIRVPVPGEHPSSEVAKTALLILGALGTLSLLVSGFLVVNTIMAVLQQHVPQIGTMKAIGARTGQIVVMYLAMVLIYGVLALLVAVPLGAAASWWFTNYTAGMLNFNRSGFRLPALTLALEATVALAVPLLAALLPIVAATRVSVREAISNYGLARAGTRPRPLPRWPLVTWLVGLVPRPLLLSLRNTFRRKARLGLTLFALTLGGATFIAVLTVQSSLGATLDDALSFRQYDVTVNFRRSYPIDQIVETMRRVPGVANAEPWLNGSAQRVHDDGRTGPAFSLVAVPAESQVLRPDVLEGRWLMRDDTNALVVNAEVLKDEPDLRVGSQITLKLAGKEVPWTVVGVIKAVMTGPTWYASYPYYTGLVHLSGRANAVQVVTERHDSRSQSAAQVALKQRLDEAGLLTGGINTTASMRQSTESQFGILVAFMSVMAVLLATVGGLGLMGTMSINVLERGREIGVMRAIGASNGAVRQIFLVEGVLIGLLSWLAGAALAIPMGSVLSRYVGVQFTRAPLTFRFSLDGALFWLLAVTLMALLASFLPAWRAARLSVREVLAYE